MIVVRTLSCVSCKSKHCSGKLVLCSSSSLSFYRSFMTFHNNAPSRAVNCQRFVFIHSNCHISRVVRQSYFGKEYMRFIRKILKASIIRQWGRATSILFHCHISRFIECAFHIWLLSFVSIVSVEFIFSLNRRFQMLTTFIWQNLGSAVSFKIN